MDAARNNDKTGLSGQKLPTHHESDEFVDVCLKAVSFVPSGRSPLCSPAVQRKFPDSKDSETGNVGGRDTSSDKYSAYDANRDSDTYTTYAGVCKTCGPYGIQRTTKATHTCDEPKRESVKNVGSAEPLPSIEVDQSEAAGDESRPDDTTKGGTDPSPVDANDADNVDGDIDETVNVSDERTDQQQPDDGDDRRRWLKKNASFATMLDDRDDKMSKDG